jgi:hypothetical protein
VSIGDTVIVRDPHPSNSKYVLLANVEELYTSSDHAYFGGAVDASNTGTSFCALLL